MDRVRAKSKSANFKPIGIAVGATLAVVSMGVALAKVDFTTHRISRDKVNIETVQRGAMEVKVSANGQLQSDNIEDLAVQVTGRVAKLYLKPGSRVEVGQHLVDLSNPTLVASAEEAQSAWEGGVKELEATRAQLNTDLQSEEMNLVEARFDMEKAETKYEAEAKIADKKIISEIEFGHARLDAGQTKELYAIKQQRLKEIRASIQVKLAVAEAHVDQLARALERARNQAASLQIVAGISGIVQAINVQVGQQLQPGTPIGRIAQDDDLYAELKVPAREAADLRVGQNAVVDTHSGIVKGTVKRIDPGVTDGAVIVDVALQGNLPPGSRPQLQVEGTVYVSQLPDTLYVGKPAYVKAGSAITVYKLDPTGRYADRTTINVGMVSVSNVQVLSGLNAGDRIITSETNEWQDKERILLN